jgi:tetratricopeptide (TPR) repeat protein
MIKFFRKIRQNLLMENKTGKYFKYAIGEIILVVIGILIALSINNWNESRKELNSELQLYSNLLSDLNSEYSSIEEQLFFTGAYDRFYFHLNKERSGQAEYDSGQNYNYLLWFHRYNIFIQEKYSESFHIIKNEKVHRKLKKFIEQEINTRNAVDDWNEHQMQIVRPFLLKHGISNTKALYNEELTDFAPIINTVNLIDYSKLKEQYTTEEFESLLFSIRFKTLWMTQNFSWLNEQNREFQVLLSHEMASTKLKGSFEPLEARTFEEMYAMEKPIDQIIAFIKKEAVNDTDYPITEGAINSFGYDLMEEVKYHDALRIFELNTELYPNQWNTYDSYGECLLELGDIENAIRAYKKSLELNPNNSSSIEALKNIIEKKNKK